MKNLNSLRPAAMRLAHKLKSDTLSFGATQTKAWKVVKVKAAMKEREVNFNFYQKAKNPNFKGQLVMTNRTGTTNLDLIPVEFHPKKKKEGAKPRKKNPTQIGYFDFMRMGWRSFSAKNYLSAVL